MFVVRFVCASGILAQLCTDTDDRWPSTSLASHVWYVDIHKPIVRSFRRRPLLPTREQPLWTFRRSAKTPIWTFWHSHESCIRTFRRPNKTIVIASLFMLPLLESLTFRALESTTQHELKKASVHCRILSCTTTVHIYYVGSWPDALTSFKHKVRFFWPGACT